MSKRKGPRVRGAKGLGTAFYSAARKCWVARKPVGHAIRGGRRVTVYVERTGATQAEAVRRRDAAGAPPATVTVAQWAERWLEELDVRPRTLASYRESVRLRIVPALGPLRLSALTAADVERAARQWGARVSANSALKHLKHLSVMLRAARRAGAIADDPVRFARKPGGVKTKIEPFAPDELRRVVAAAAADPRTHRLALMAALGLRIGEALGLEPGDYDPHTHTLSVRRTLHKDGTTGPPKSKNSVRDVRVPEPVRHCAARPGPRVGYDAGEHRWRGLLARLGIAHRNPHQARHTVATLAIAAGAPVANVARDLGDSLQTLIATYVHPTPAGPDLCATMGAILGAQGGDKVAGGARKGVRAQGKPGSGTGGS